LRGQDGEGIVIAENANQLVTASLYTQYIDKTSEYRIHVGRLPNGQITVIGRQKKRKTASFTGDARIWTGNETKLDYIELAPEEVISAARKAFTYFKVSFAAFDIVYNNSMEEAYVLEANSAPMLNADTVKAYAEFFREYGKAVGGTTAQAPAAPTPAPVQAVPTPTPAQTAPISGSTAMTAFVKAQLAAGHITEAKLLAEWSPIKPTTEELIDNYVNKLTA
jgi:hypothetical protein